MMHGVDWSKWKDGTPVEKMSLLPGAQEHIVEQENGKDRFIQIVTELSQAFALCAGTEEAIEIRDDIGFFQAVKAAAEKPWTTKVWIYDLRTNKHFTLRENPLKRSDLDDFVSCYFGRARSPSAPKETDGPAVRPYQLSRHDRKESDRFKAFSYEELTKSPKSMPGNPSIYQFFPCLRTVWMAILRFAVEEQVL